MRFRYIEKIPVEKPKKKAILIANSNRVLGLMDYMRIYMFISFLANN